MSRAHEEIYRALVKCGIEHCRINTDIISLENQRNKCVGFLSLMLSLYKWGLLYKKNGILYKQKVYLQATK